MGSYLMAMVLGQQNRLIAALRAAGATSPATAQPLAKLNVDAQDATWMQLVRQGRIREATPGSFYLFALPRPDRRERAIKWAVFYLLILLIPLALMLLSKR
jgi:hypothetical protein